jgi:hypothetical protein
MLRFLVVTTSLAALAVANPVPPQLIVVERDTIGGTTYDWQQSGPAIQTVANDPMYGVHVTWMYSHETGPYPDRNKRYNFYDNLAGAWNFLDPTNYMNSGVNSFVGMTGYGSLDVNPVTGCAYISAHYSTYPSVVKDAAPGAGIWSECAGPPNCSACVWPVTGTTSDEKVHSALIDAASRSMVYYSRIDPWCTWSLPFYISSPPGVDPAYPSHNLAVSRVSNQVIITWTDPLESNVELFLRQSTDGGLSWNDPYSLPPPPAFTPGSDTTPQYDLTGAYVAFDRADNWHLLTTVIPEVAGMTYVMPAEIWHYCPVQTPQWSRIRRAECDTQHLAGSLGYAASYACRPSIAFGHDRCCFVVWEEFDSSNVEPSTGLLRADIKTSLSQDDGQSWSPDGGSALTSPDSTSKRFPFVAWNADNDTMHIVYEQDLQAGFPIKSQGIVTNNPIVYVKATWFGSGVKAEHPAEAIPSLAVAPNPFRERVRFQLHGAHSGELRIHDAAGRVVRELNVSGLSGAAVWDGRNALGAHAPAGVYFYDFVTSRQDFKGKVLRTD